MLQRFKGKAGTAFEPDQRQHSRKDASMHYESRIPHRSTYKSRGLIRDGRAAALLAQIAQLLFEVIERHCVAKELRQK